MKRLIYTFIVCLFLFIPFSLNAQQLKIAYVDLQRALNESLAGKDAKEKFAQEVKKIEQKINERKEEIRRLTELLERQSMMLNEEVRRQKEKDLMKKQRDYERFVKDSKDELQLKDAELTQKILKELAQLIEKYGRENNYTFIFERNATFLLYATPALDLTDKIIALYDAQYRSKKK